MDCGTKNKNICPRTLERRIIYPLIAIATLGTWTLIAFSVTWVLGAIGWFLLARLWWHELFVPKAVSSTVLAVLIAILWAILLWCIAVLWAQYHYRRYYQHNRRQLLPPVMGTQPLLWQECLLDTSCTSVSAFTSGVRAYKETAVAIERPVSCKYNSYKSGAALTLQEDFWDETGTVVVAAGEIITANTLKNTIARGLYGELVATLTNQILAEED